jgi:hypothetical protein
MLTDKFGSSPAFQAIESIKEQRMIPYQGFPTKNHTSTIS